ncbi:hypothetical protein SLA2020_072040 [Shorea laevis]
MIYRRHDFALALTRKELPPLRQMIREFVSGVKKAMELNEDEGEKTYKSSSLVVQEGKRNYEGDEDWDVLRDRNWNEETRNQKILLYYCDSEKENEISGDHHPSFLSSTPHKGTASSNFITIQKATTTLSRWIKLSSHCNFSF